MLSVYDMNVTLQDVSNKAIRVMLESLEKEVLLDYDPISPMGDPNVCRLQKETIGMLRMGILQTSRDSSVECNQVSRVNKEAMNKVDEVEGCLERFRTAVWAADSQIDILYVQGRDSVLTTLGELHQIMQATEQVC